ncbi:MAG: PAS domain S-box protein [Alphaproteobacteria bacterium]|nr:PAS domain S-box protein [Alphaproteobacteria bacterium]
MASATQTESFSEKQLRAILENTVDGIIVINSKGIILSFNRACEKLFGYTAKEAINQNVKILMPQSHSINHDGYINNYLTTHEAKIIGIGREVTGLRKDGSIFPMWLSIGEVIEDDSHFFVGIVRDITAQKEHEIQKQIYTQALEKSNRELDDFVYIVSHDLKEPMRGIYSYSQFMWEDYNEQLDDEGKNKLTSLMKMSQRMNELIDTLLYFSRLNKTDLSYADMDINQVIRQVLETFELFLKEHNAKIIIDNPLPVTKCDQSKVGEIFRNLIVNGIKYNDSENKEIHIGTCEREECPEQTVFYVQDNGIGILEKHHHSVFKMFKRLHGRDAYGGGTGSGLTIVKRIIDQHGGKIWIDTPSSGGGTYFLFTLGTGNHE